MKKIFSGVAALVTAAVAVVAMSGAAQAKPTDGDWQGCPYGAVGLFGQNVNPWANPPDQRVLELRRPQPEQPVR
ncbi:hypothetical protein ACWGDS_06515 [Streptomyces sp. NPDC055059]|jgi:hypothetical protein|uniref:hypothetical protein n=1 Tax=unclassified Streptomyces TaxID=2593676 RepID=UPI0033A317FF